MTDERGNTTQGASLGSVSGGPGKGLPWQRHRILFALLFGAIVVVAILVAAYSLIDYRQSTAPTLSESTYKLKNASADSDEKVSQITIKYSRQYDEYLAELNSSAPSKWDRAMLDKAYFCLVYADKTSSPYQVLLMLEDIERARSAGVNVDKNGWDIKQTDRDSMKKRAEERRNA